MDPRHLAAAITDGPTGARRRAWIAAVAFPERVLGRSHEEEYAASLHKTALLLSFFAQHDIKNVDDQEAISEALGAVLPLDMHRKMYVPALRISMSPDQWARWSASPHRFIGAYAQTELGASPSSHLREPRRVGHGSNVRAIETTATYDADRGDFDLHSPTLTSRKWWPGGLGKTATFAVVYARLLHAGTDYGVHAFHVQLRHEMTHKSLEGVTLGDIGAKVGFNGVDNGFCAFDHVRVPKDGLLLGAARVAWSATGELQPAPASAPAQWGYFTMVKTRVFLVGKAARFLARALAITLPEVAGRPAVARMLYPSVGLALAAAFAGQALHQLYQRVLLARDVPELRRLHALSSGLKALVTTRAVDGIDACVRAGGYDLRLGHAVPYLRAEIVGSVTYEGTFDVLVLQHGAALRKSPPLSVTRRTWRLDEPDDVVALFERRVQNLRDARGKSAFWTTKLSVAASELQLLLALRDAAVAQADAPTCRVLWKLWQLLAFQWMVESLHEFRAEGMLSSAQGDALVPTIEAAAQDLDDNILNVVAAWGFTEKEKRLLHAKL
ncbi:peroxisomal acyl-coenzyme A oxidase 1 [Achlya hypogyna]|uniref:Peroxisomal acyl-coenzyme A oxidase 1 n=1 Tax=Achlya hypogyna TaxID=1202772 RepID=A0A1V9YXB7_ACHHY|nr:peroxisomal acyl-coenzyme A oxidase 1 [Achlya hypogyna]